jgi:hypothetical protein
MNTNDKNTNPDIGDDLRITKTTRRNAGAGTWVIGTISGHLFNALVFPSHAEYEGFELGDSRISKLWIKRIKDKRTMANFDRGWDIYPQTHEAQTIVNFLAAGLAESIYHS